MWKVPHSLIDEIWIPSLIVSSQCLIRISGSGDYGQLGHGTKEGRKSPELVSIIHNCRVEKVACTDHSSFAIAKAKNHQALNSVDDRLVMHALSNPEKTLLLSWGRGNTGALGNGTYDD